MADVKRIVCLANSRKLSGRCVAGKEIGTNCWIRPVSDRENGEVSEYERQYEDGTDPLVLDIIDVPLLEAHPKDFQQENWLLDPDRYWRRVRRVRWSELTRLVDPAEPLWIDGSHTSEGVSDKIALQLMANVHSSLRLIQVEHLRLSVASSGGFFGRPKRRVQGWFTHNGTTYHLWVTDPVYERRFLAKPDGCYDLGDCLLTISLGEPFNGACYKLIAAIIERDEKA